MALKELLTNLVEGLDSYPNHNTPSTSGGFNYGQSTTRIFDSKTFRQRDFKFGEGTAFDRPGNEFSREPLIGRNVDIPGPNDQPGAGGFLNLIGSLTDGFVRGGIVNAVERSAQDVARLTRFYLTSRGIGFLAKQTALQLTNPRTPVGSTTIFGLELSRTRTFNLGLNILAQAGVNFSGVHFDRSGLTPIFPEEDKYETFYSNLSRISPSDDEGTIDNNKGITGGNRLITLHKAFTSIIDGDIESSTAPGSTLFEYNGWPDSIYGICKTTIRKFTDTRASNLKFENGQAREDLLTDFDFNVDSEINVSNLKFVERATNPGYGYLPHTFRNSKSVSDIWRNSTVDEFLLPSRLTLARSSYVGFGTNFVNPFAESDDVQDKSSFAIESNGLQRLSDTAVANALGGLTYNNILEIGVSNPNTSNIIDFRLRKQAQGINIQGFDYQQTTGNNKKYIIEQRINTGNPGNNELKRSPYNTYDAGTVDRLNALDVIRIKDDVFTAQEYRDLIRFRIEAIDTDKPDEADVMFFRAFLDSYSDNFNGNWNAFTYNGRGEELYTYQGFKRDVSFNFKIAAQSRHEMMPLYRKLNFLVSQTAPDYSGTRMRGNFVRITIGSLLDRTPGVINSVGLTWQKDYPWEISIDSPENGRDTETQVLPHVLDVSVKFTPVHNFLPKKSVTDSPFIFLHNRNGKITESRKWYHKGASQSIYEASVEGQHARGLGAPLQLPGTNNETNG